MTRSRSALFNIMISICVLAGLAACGAGPSQPARYFILAAESPQATGDDMSSVAVGIGPVTLAPHLDRAQIVTLASANRLDLTVVDQWAEPLRAGVSRVVRQNVSSLTGSDTVYRFPLRLPVSVTYQVALDIQRFDTDAAGTSTLVAHWDVMIDGGEAVVSSQTKTYQTQIAEVNVENQVAAMSANLADLSRDIVASLKP